MRRFLDRQATILARESRSRIFNFYLHTHSLYTDGWVVADDLSHLTTTTFQIRRLQRFPKVHRKRVSGCSAPAWRLKNHLRAFADRGGQEGLRRKSCGRRPRSSLSVAPARTALLQAGLRGADTDALPE